MTIADAASPSPAATEPQAADDSAAPAAPADQGGILDVYLKTAPSSRNAVELFKGEWSSKFPPPFDDMPVGGVPLFQDSRLAWALEKAGGVRGQSVLELGPLEGGHSYMFEKYGAASVVAIEANSRAYLKCLIVKELFDLKKVRFLCGDFVPYLHHTTEQFDFIQAAGVLYHMKDPIELLRLISLHTSRAFIWTHYYDEAIIKNNPVLAVKFPSHITTEFNGRPIPLYRQEYQVSLQQPGFCGGSNLFSHWLTRSDLLDVLRQFGFDQVTVNHESLDHPHGPCLSLLAVKTDTHLGASSPTRPQSWLQKLKARF